MAFSSRIKITLFYRSKQVEHGSHAGILIEHDGRTNPNSGESCPAGYSLYSSQDS